MIALAVGQGPSIRGVVLANDFDENTVIFELMEDARGGGHDGSACIAVIGFGD